MKNNKIILVIIISALLINLVSATDSVTQTLGTFKAGQVVPLYQGCISSTYSNITKIILTNSNVNYSLTGNFSMTKTGDDYTYLITFQSPGRYIVYGNCNENGNYTKWGYDLFITSTGYAFGSNLMMWLILVILSFLLMIIYMWSNQHMFGVVSGMLFLVSGVFMLIYGFGEINDVYTRSLAYVFIGFGMLFTVASALNWANDAEGGTEE